MLQMRHECPSEVCGYLVKAGRVSVRRRKYFFRLNGSFLSRHRTEGSKSTWSMNIVGASVIFHARNGIVLEVKTEHIVLYAKNEDESIRWYDALKCASQHKVETYYHVKKVIGAGGFASVRLGIDKRSREHVAIKTIGKKGSTPTFLQREISILKTVNHANVVNTFDIFETDEKYQIVMEYMEGGSLFEEISRRKRFEEREARHVMQQILKGIAYLHSSGIVHRDLKPENILLASRDALEIKLADFGLSKFYDESSEKLMQTLIGTPQFVAPELVQNEEYGAEVDLWAAGMLMYNLLTGDVPFSAKEVIGKYEAKQFEIPYRKKAWKAISPDATRLTKQLLCKDVSRRLSAIGALQHTWFRDRHENENQGSHLYGRSPLSSFRKAVHCTCFILRLSAKAGMMRKFTVPARQLELKRSGSCASATSIASSLSSNLSDWDFHEEDLIFNGSISPMASAGNNSRQTSVRSLHDAQRIQLLKNLTAKIESADATMQKKSKPAERKHPKSDQRSFSVKVGTRSEFGPQSYGAGSVSKRAASERPLFAELESWTNYNALAANNKNPRADVQRQVHQEDEANSVSESTGGITSTKADVIRSKFEPKNVTWSTQKASTADNRKAAAPRKLLKVRNWLTNTFVGPKEQDSCRRSHANSGK